MHFPVQAGAEQGFVQVVVVADVTAAGGDAVPGAEQHFEGVQPQVLRQIGFKVDAQESQKPVQPALAGVPFPGHVGLAEVQRGIAQNAVEGGSLAQPPNGNGRPLSKAVLAPGVVHHPELALLNELLKKLVHWRTAGPLP